MTLIRLILLACCMVNVHNRTVGCVIDLPRNAPSNATRLEICVTEQTELTQNDFKRFTVLDYLAVDHGTVIRFQPDTFRNLTSLTYLSLFNNSITSLPLRAFPPSLRQLDLGYNNIATIRRHMFYGLGNVTNLRLHRNVIANIQEGAFDPLVKLAVLELQGNHLTEFPRGLVLNQLTKLDLSQNQISRLTSDDFSGLTKLETFTIEWNNIRALPNDLKTSFNRLNSISVANNPIHCNCFTKWLVESRSLQRKIGNGKCATPTVNSLARSTVHVCTPPNIVSPSYDIITRAGEEYTIECKAVSDPAPTITFFIDGEYYASYPASTDITEDKNTVSLTYVATGNKSYTCQAENIEGSANVTRNVMVFGDKLQPPPPYPSPQLRQLTTSEMVSGSGPDVMAIGVGVGVGVLVIVGTVVVVVIVTKKKKANTVQVLRVNNQM